MLGDRFYAVWDPSLVQAVFRNTQLSLLPLATEFAQKQLNLSENAANLVRTTDMMPEFTSLLHSSMTGKYVPSMNQIALGYISDELSSKFTEKQSVEVPSFYGWLRDLVTMATSEGLYGPGNILRHNLKLIDDLWYDCHYLSGRQRSTDPLVGTLRQDSLSLLSGRFQA